MVCLQRVSLNPVRRSRHRLYLALTRSRAAGSCFGARNVIIRRVNGRQFPAIPFGPVCGRFVGDRSCGFNAFLSRPYR